MIKTSQVKSVRSPPWYVKTASFKGKMLGEITIYVWIGREDARKPVRYFITKNRDCLRKSPQAAQMEIQRVHVATSCREVREQLGPAKTLRERAQGDGFNVMPGSRRFPPPWTIEEANAACFIVKDHNGQALAYVYYETEHLAVALLRTC
jgi:hypothetical protein